jgi:hypothetical protein
MQMVQVRLQNLQMRKVLVQHQKRLLKEQECPQTNQQSPVRRRNLLLPVQGLLQTNRQLPVRRQINLLQLLVQQVRLQMLSLGQHRNQCL